MMTASEESVFQDPICHVHHIDLITDPVSTVESVYKHFGMMLPDDVAGRIMQRTKAQPNGGYGEHHYDFADHGLNEPEEQEKFRPYMIHFGIASESGSTVRPASRVEEPAARGEHSLLS